ESRASIISSSRGFLNGFDCTMQLQVGCPGGCLFCYVPNSPRLAPADIRSRSGFEIREKKNAISRLKGHLDSGLLAGKKLYWSAVTDPYAVRPSVTRALWETLLVTPQNLRPCRIVVQTRFRVDRDRKLISEYAESTQTPDGRTPALISFTISTDRNDLIYSWERATPDYEQRMNALVSLRKSGIQVIPTLSPFSIWNDLRLTLNRFREMDIRVISVIFLKEGTSTANTPRPFLEYTKKYNPCLLDKSWQKEQLTLMESVMGRGNVLVGQQGFSSLADASMF
ncbi:MAG: hypothetical protein KAH12_11780, partial [Anaerolineales bacterium]|nr:hypothetical protein [Anaerolineales bacterium]